MRAGMQAGADRTAGGGRRSLAPPRAPVSTLDEILSTTAGAPADFPQLKSSATDTLMRRNAAKRDPLNYDHFALPLPGLEWLD